MAHLMTTSANRYGMEIERLFTHPGLNPDMVGFHPIFTTPPARLFSYPF
jgi:hypothetical protein